MTQNSRYWMVTGGSGMVGSALKKELLGITPKVLSPSSSELNLLNRTDIEAYLLENQAIDGLGVYTRIGCAFHLAESSDAASSLETNLLMNTNFLGACSSDKEAPIEKVVSVLSTDVYPDSPYVKYPLTEDQVHLGPPSRFVSGYTKRMLDVHSQAIRQQKGLKYVTVISNNIFGEGDNFGPDNGRNLIPVLIRKIWEAKLCNLPTVTIWGDAGTIEELTYVKDIARILVVVANEYSSSLPLNIGNTEELSVAEIAAAIKQMLGYDGRLICCCTGRARKPTSNQRLLDSASWKKEQYTPFLEALQATCKWFVENYPNVRGISSK